MNAKEARKLSDACRTFDGNCDDLEHREAKGYLEALKGEEGTAMLEAAEAVEIYFKVLVEKWAANDGRLVSDNGVLIEGSEEVERLCEIAGQKVMSALAQYREAIKK